MTSDSWSLILSLVGLFLGFVSAYGQIRGFFVRVFKAGGTSLSRWAKRRDEKIELLSTHPSALIAYIARSVLYISATAIFGLTVAGLIRINFGSLDALRTAVLMGGASLIGLELGRLHTTILDVSKRTLRQTKDSDR